MTFRISAIDFRQTVIPLGLLGALIGECFHAPHWIYISVGFAIGVGLGVLLSRPASSPRASPLFDCQP